MAVTRLKRKDRRNKISSHLKVQHRKLETARLYVKSPNKELYEEGNAENA